MTDDLRESPLAAVHAEAGARLAPFAGWAMPVRFAGTLAEHEAVRTNVGIFDVSHLGTVWIDGGSAVGVVARTFTNDPTTLDDGASQYTLCCDERGGIVDDLIVYRLAADRWLAVPNAANTAAVVETLRGAAKAVGATVRDESLDWAIVAIQGPAALALADQVVAHLGGGSAVSAVDHLGVVEVELADHRGVVCRTGYTGEPGCEILVPGALAPRVWELAVAGGAEPCGLGARDTLRLEMGYPLHGNELSRERDPYEARLGWAVKLDREPFRGQDALRASKQHGPARRLWGLRSDERRPLRADLTVSRDGAAVGVTTSGGVSPTLDRGIALAYVDVEVERGDTVQVDRRGSTVECEVVRPPFVDRDPRG